MTKRIEVLDAQGVVINTIIASEEMAESIHPGRWRVAADQGVVPRNLGTRISKLAFMLRMGGGNDMPVWKKLEIASQHDNGAARPVKERTAALRTAKDLMSATKDSVDLALPLTVLQVNNVAALLVAANEINQTEANALIAAVLDTSTITEAELP